MILADDLFVSGVAGVVPAPYLNGTTSCEDIMKATLNGTLIAESDDIVSVGGYAYFPSPAVRTEFLHKTDKTPKDLECPHSVQFYDVVLDGERHPRAAWLYEAPRPSMAQVAGRFGFWEDVKVG
jgi:uncharacterized protein (DUF427 family)